MWSSDYPHPVTSFPNSKAIVASVGNDKPFRYNPDMGFILVPPGQKKIDLKLVQYPDESDKGPFPIPIGTSGEPGGAVRDPSGEIGPAFHGSGTRAYQTARAAQDQGVDRGTESCVAGMGPSLQASPRPKALPPARRLDCAAHSVASIQALAERWLATVAGTKLYGEYGLVNLIQLIPSIASRKRESS